MSEQTRIAAEQAIYCLRLEAPQSVVDDVEAKINAHLRSEGNRIAELEAEVECHKHNHDVALDLLDEARKEVERLQGLLSEWIGQHAAAEGLLADTKATIEAGEGE